MQILLLFFLRIFQKKKINRNTGHVLYILRVIFVYIVFIKVTSREDVLSMTKFIHSIL
jgi:hypothetical protein